MIQTLSFPRKRAISELSTSLQLPTQTLFIQCKWCIVGVQQQPLVLYLDIQLKCFLNIDDGSQTYSEVSAIDRMMEILGTGTNQTAHVLRDSARSLVNDFLQLFCQVLLLQTVLRYGRVPKACFQMSGLRAGYTSVNIWQYLFP